MSWISAIVPLLGKYVYPTALFVQTLSIYMTFHFREAAYTAELVHASFPEILRH